MRRRLDFGDPADIELNWMAKDRVPERKLFALFV